MRMCVSAFELLWNLTAVFDYLDKVCHLWDYYITARDLLYLHYKWRLLVQPRVQPTHPLNTNVETLYWAQDPLLFVKPFLCRTRHHLSDRSKRHNLLVWFDSLPIRFFWLVSPCNEVVLTLVNKWKDISAIYHKCDFFKAWRNWVKRHFRKKSITIELCHKCSCVERIYTAHYV